jgi:hypothetical protein
MNTEVHEEVKVEDLKEGDLIDLENDPFADPYGAVGYTEDEPGQDCTNRDILRGWHDYEADHDKLGFEYAQVEGVNVVKYDLADAVQVYTDLINVDFPLGHTVKRYVPDVKMFGSAQVMVDGQPWKDGDGNDKFPIPDAQDLATRVRDQGYTDVYLEYLDD